MLHFRSCIDKFKTSSYSVSRVHFAAVSQLSSRGSGCCNYLFLLYMNVSMNE